MFHEIREEKENILKTVSDYLGIAPKFLQRYECGEIKIDVIKLLCTFYRVDCLDFMKEAKARFISNEELKTKTLSMFKNDLEKESVLLFLRVDEQRKNAQKRRKAV